MKLTGRIAQQLVREGSIADYYAAQPRTTVRRRRGNITSLFGVGGIPSLPSLAAPAPRATAKRPRGFFGFGFGAPPPVPDHAAAAPRLITAAAPCPPGTERNPTTGRCIKIGGRTYKRVLAPPPPVAVAPPPPVLPPPVRPPPPRSIAPAPIIPPVVPPRPIRAASSEPPPFLPTGMSGVTPLADRRTMLSWLTDNCSNDRDPLTGQRLATAAPEYLQQTIRLHNRTCTSAPALDAKVTAEHRVGNVATVPGDPSTHMTLDDFKALRSAMRRRDPAYKIPARRHQPPPDNWKLYIASDNRSGPEYASVMFLDVTKAERTPEGIQYPLTAVRMDLGYIPITDSGSTTCSPQTLVDLIKHANERNRLVSPVAGGWKPNAGFPFLKKMYWETGRAEKVSRLCRDLAAVASRPF